MRYVIALLTSALLALAGPAHAVSLTYTITGTGSGTLGSDSFTDAAFTFTLVGDTANDVGNEINPLTSATATIAGLGTTTFTEATRLGYNTTNSVVYFSRASGLDLFDFGVAPGLDLFAPFSVVGNNIFALNQFNIGTSLGALTFSDSSEVVFTNVAAIPEPSTWALMVGGLAMCAALGRRKTKV